MRTNAPEPGFVQAFRIFVALRILFWLAVGPVLLLLELAGNPVLQNAVAAGRPLLPFFTVPYLAPLLAIDLVLLGLLVWPHAAERVGRWYVPLTLVLGVLPLLVGYYRWPAENPLQSPFAMFFFVTALLIAWEYKYTYVALYVAALTLFQIGVMPAWPIALPWTIPTGWLVLQAVMLLLAGYITATLVSVQSGQRAALATAYEQQAEANRRLQQYAATLEELAITRERNRIARELHDTLAHSLSALTVQLEAVQALWESNPAKARKLLTQANETARLGLAEARRALRALRAAPLEDLGLVLALQELAATAAERSGAELSLEFPDAYRACLSGEIEQGVYRIAQEALENVVRHAGAHRISLELAEVADNGSPRLVLTIRDDGYGADLEAVEGEGQTGDGRLGIRGMRERASIIGAELAMESTPGAGTTVTLTVPIEGGNGGPCSDM